MSNIKELKKRVKSTKSTLKITSAMKLVAASKFVKAQTAIINARAYSEEIERVVRALSCRTQDYSHPFLGSEDNHKNNKALLLVISSDKGLCGSYNTGLAKYVRTFLQTTAKEEELDVTVSFAGKKARDNLKKDVKLGENFTFAKSDPLYEEIAKIAERLAELYKNGEYGRVYVAYNIFKNAITIIPSVKQLLPVPKAVESQCEEEASSYIEYEPGAPAVLDYLLPEAYSTQLHACFLNAKAAEYSNKMTAMDNATKNCQKFIRTLTLKINKLRQSSITTQLIEVVAGAESQNG